MAIIRTAKQIFTRQSSREEGQTMAEYGLILAGIAIVVVVGVNLLGTNLLGLFNNLAGSF